jgi:hypothetical protein
LQSKNWIVVFEIESHVSGKRRELELMNCVAVCSNEMKITEEIRVRGDESESEKSISALSSKYV